MTNEEALLEAKKRWGDQGEIMVEKHEPLAPDVRIVGVKIVGVMEINFHPLGSGWSWEEAFRWANKIEEVIR